jgi:peptidoglycan/LPS O-acetylase OafA/YrhL
LSKTESPTEYFGNLESLRGIAAFIIALAHIAWVYPFYHAPIIRNGYLMVDFFFVLSGFVIYHSYRNKIDGFASLKKFMWLRFWRLYPLHFAFLLAFVGIECIEWVKEYVEQDVGDAGAFQAQNNLFSFFTNLFLVHSLGIHDRLTYNAPSWSISTEFYTYLLFGVVMCLFSSPTARRAVSFLLMVTGVGVLLYAGNEHLMVMVDYGFFRCVAGFFAGMLVYDVYRFIRDRPASGNLEKFFGFTQVVVLVGIVGYLALKSKGYSDYAIIPLVSVVVLATALVPDGLAGKVLSLKPLRWSGKVSYSIYMVHPAVLWAYYQILKFILKIPAGVDPRFDRNLLSPSPLVGTLFFVVGIASVLIVSEFTYRWIENPFRLWSKKRLRST